MYSVIVAGAIIVIVLIILDMARRCLGLGPRYVVALATLVTAIAGLVAAFEYLM